MWHFTWYHRAIQSHSPYNTQCVKGIFCRIKGTHDCSNSDKTQKLSIKEIEIANRLNSMFRLGEIM